MAKRGSKLLALALSILVARSFVALVETPQVHLGNRHKPPSRTTRTAVDFAKVAQYLEPFVTVIGITRKDVWQGALDANNNLRLISNQTALVDIKEAQAHAECLAQTLVESASTSEKARNIFLPNISLPLIPVNGTEFQHLVSNVLSDLTLTGVSSIHAEPGVGKSVAVTLAILGWAKGNPKSITVLIRGNLQLLEDFFRVSKEAYVPAVAENLFRILSDEGVRLQLVLDNVFDKKLGERGEMLMSLARAAFKYGQVVVVTQSREVAEEIGLLNGARTRVSPHQKCNASDYRWNEMQASTLLLNLNATAKLNRSMKESEDIVQRALTESFEKFKQDGAWVQENLEGARMPDGGWKPVDIEQFLISGIKPVLVPAVAGGDCREGLVWKNITLRMCEHSTCRRADFLWVNFFFFPASQSHILNMNIADQSKLLQNRPNLSSSRSARYNLSNPDQSCLGEATAEGLTRVVHTCRDPKNSFGKRSFRFRTIDSERSPSQVQNSCK